MLLQASHIFRMPVASLEDNAKIGDVKLILIDKKLLKVAGFIIHFGGIFSGKNLLLSETDILDIDKNGVVIRSKENLIDPTEVLRIKKLVDERFNLFGLRARTKSKKNLGKISDFVLDSTAMQIVKFHINHTLEDRIIDLSKVVKVSNKEIVFEDDIEEIPAETVAEEALA
jgi:uncharacterized protein YrrD